MIPRQLKEELELRSEWAQRYAAMGWPILPTNGIDLAGRCTCGNARCDRPGKHPARKNYKAMATLDPATLKSYWLLVPFNLSLLIPPGLLVLDVDDVAAMEPLARFGGFPVTPTHTTRRGFRMFYAWPRGEEAPSIGGLDRTKLDILGTGNLCILPPSTAAVPMSAGSDSNPYLYRWQPGEDPWDCPVAELPAPFVEHLRKVATVREKRRRAGVQGVTTHAGALKLARRRSGYAGFASNGVARGAAGLTRTLQEAGARPEVIEAALVEYHLWAGR